MKNEKLFKIKEVAEIIDVDRRTIHIWIKKGKIRSVKTLGGVNRIPESELKRIMRTMGLEVGEAHEEGGNSSVQRQKG